MSTILFQWTTLARLRWEDWRDDWWRLSHRSKWNTLHPWDVSAHGQWRWTASNDHSIVLLSSQPTCRALSAFSLVGCPKSETKWSIRLSKSPMSEAHRLCSLSYSLETPQVHHDKPWNLRWSLYSVGLPGHLDDFQQRAPRHHEMRSLSHAYCVCVCVCVCVLSLARMKRASDFPPTHPSIMFT